MHKTLQLPATPPFILELLAPETLPLILPGQFVPVLVGKFPFHFSQEAFFEFISLIMPKTL